MWVEVLEALASTPTLVHGQAERLESLAARQEQVVLKHEEMVARLTALEEVDVANKLAAQTARIAVLEKKPTLNFGGTGLLPKPAHLPSMSASIGENVVAVASGLLPVSASQSLAIVQPG